jgi:pSer/pThr/pTyr-binding forkhead associated (FHA) protein
MEGEGASTRPNVSLEDVRIHKVGFARLLGKNIDHIMNKYDIILGRTNKNKPIDVAVGDTMSVSRQHARIYYNFSKTGFFLEVMGKNGVTVDGHVVSPGDPPVRLKSQARLQIGGDVTFYFLLPKNLAKVFPSSKPREDKSLLGKRVGPVDGLVQTERKKQAIESQVVSVADAFLNAIRGGLPNNNNNNARS